jgi:CheY-like chemotaxis protein
MSASLANSTILIVDDNDDIRNLLQSAFEAAGASVVTAHSVDAALDAFRRCPPHAVVTDIRLGNSDGYVLIHAIRQINAEYKGFTPVIATTGYASPEDEQRAKSAGFTAYMSKPFDPAEVVRTIGTILAGPRGRTA